METTDESICHELKELWHKLKKKPEIIVFDLDYTLWPYYVDCHVSPPIRKNKNNIITDTQNFEVRGFDHVPKILKTLREHCLGPNQHLAIASKSTTPELARQSLDLLDWSKYFSSFQIYPKSKDNHMKQIQQELNFDRFENVLFFDDEHNNIVTTSRMGVKAILVEPSKGVDLHTIKQGLEHFNSKH